MISTYFSIKILSDVFPRVLLFFVGFYYFPFWDPPGSLPVDSLSAPIVVYDLYTVLYDPYIVLYSLRWFWFWWFGWSWWWFWWSWRWFLGLVEVVDPPRGFWMLSVWTLSVWTCFGGPGVGFGGPGGGFFSTGSSSGLPLLLQVLKTTARTTNTTPRTTQTTRTTGKS